MDSYFIRVNRLPGSVRTVLAPITRMVLGFHPWQNNSDFIPDWNWKSKETGEQERRIPLHRPAGYQLGLWILALILCETDIDEIEAVGGLGDDVGGQIGGAQRHGQHGLHGTDSGKERLRRIV